MLIFPRAEVQEGLTSLLPPALPAFRGVPLPGSSGGRDPAAAAPRLCSRRPRQPPPAHTLTNNYSSSLSIHDYIVTLGFAQLLQSTLGHATCPSLQQHYGGGRNLVWIPEGAGFRAPGGKAGGSAMVGP